MHGPLPSSLFSLSTLASLAYGQTSLCEPQDRDAQEWLNNHRYSQRTLKPCQAPELSVFGEALEADRAALDELRIQVDWMPTSLNPTTHVGLLQRFEVLTDPPTGSAIDPPGDLGDRLERRTCRVQDTLPVLGEPRLLTVFSCAGFERIPYTFALWRPVDSSGRLVRLEALSKILLFASIGRIEVRSAVALPGGEVLLHGTNDGGDIESWRAAWVGVLQPPAEFSLLFQDATGGSIQLDYFFDPRTFELILRHRDEALCDVQHDGNDWPPTLEKIVDIEALLRKEGLFP